MGSGFESFCNLSTLSLSIIFMFSCQQHNKCTVSDLGPIHEEGPHMANCMACQCACKTSKDLADKILGGDTRTTIPEPKVKQTSGDKVSKLTSFHMCSNF